MPLYNVFIERKAEKEFQKLPKDIQKRIFLTILSFKDNPKLVGVRKISGFDDYYRFRVGDYRIVYEINEKRKEVKIFIIRHRKNAYKF